MKREYRERVVKLEKIGFEEKTIKVRLISEIKEAIQSLKMEILKEEKKKRKAKIKEFADSFKLNICISSPMSRT